jgi:hypothetical protein
MSRPARRRHIFKRLNTHYRLVFIDDTSLQEVASFRLTMRKLYILFSSIFVFVIVVTVAILLLTPLKYYIPGYAGGSDRREVIQLKRTVDSLTDLTAASDSRRCKNETRHNKTRHEARKPGSNEKPGTDE